MKSDEFDLYTEKVMEYFEKPKNIGKIKDADSVAIVGNPKCGDVMKVYLKIDKRTIGSQLSAGSENAKQKTESGYEEYIKDIKVQTLGCAAAIATSSIMTELVKGKSLEDALKVTNADVTENLGGLPVVKQHCSLLAEQGIKKAIKKYYDSKNDK